MCGMAAPNVPQPSQQHTTDTNTGHSTLLGNLLDRINRLESTQLQNLQHSKSPNAMAFLAGGVPSEPSTPAPGTTPKKPGNAAAEEDAKDPTTDDDADAADSKVGALEKLVLGTAPGSKKRLGKRPAASTPCKKPPAKNQAGKKPPVPADAADTIHWGGGKIYVSLSKKAYRVIPRYGIKSDTLLLGQSTLQSKKLGMLLSRSLKTINEQHDLACC